MKWQDIEVVARWAAKWKTHKLQIMAVIGGKTWALAVLRRSRRTGKVGR